MVLTPLVAAAFFGQPVGRMGWAAVGLSTVGIALLVLRSTSLTAALSTGALLTVAGAGCFAMHAFCLGLCVPRIASTF